MVEHRVLIISADPLTRAGLGLLLDQEDFFTVVAQLSPSEFVQADLDLHRPTVLVWDVGWDVELTAEDWEELGELEWPTAVLLPDEEFVTAALAVGVAGILLRNAPIERLAAALQGIGQDLTVIDPDLASVLRETGRGQGGGLSLPETEALTSRESEVLHLMAQGLTNKGISGALGISTHTVKFHVTAVMDKLDAQSRTEAVVQGMRYGILRL